MSMHDKTLKLVTNLDRAGIEARLAEVRSAAKGKNLAELAALRGKPEHGGISALVELVELNLPNLK